jgi:hypothetical protein
MPYFLGPAETPFCSASNTGDIGGTPNAFDLAQKVSRYWNHPMAFLP